MVDFRKDKHRGWGNANFLRFIFNSGGRYRGRDVSRPYQMVGIEEVGIEGGMGLFGGAVGGGDADEFEAGGCAAKDVELEASDP